MVGFDYGIKAKIVVVGDIEYASVLHQAEPCAVGYGLLPYFELLNKPMFVSLVFKNEEKGRESFQHLKRWVDISQSSEAVVLSFIEDKMGGYTVCVYPEFDLLRKRCIPEYMQQEVDPLVLLPSAFPVSVRKISEQYLEFKRYSSKNPFVFCGASKTGLFLDLAIVKRNANFFQEGNIPDNAIEKYVEKKDEPISNPKKPPIEAPGNIFMLRRQKLKRYFPISIDRIHYIDTFKKSLQELESRGFQKWQIEQAACNLILSYRLTHKLFFEGLDERTAHSKILDHLLLTFERIDSEFPSEGIFNPSNLQQQIRVDMKELSNYLGVAENEDEVILMREIGKNGFLIES